MSIYQSFSSLYVLTIIFRLYFYVEFAFACALLIFAFFFVEETAYTRKVASQSQDQSDGLEKSDVRTIETLEVAPPRRPFLQTLKPWSGIDRDAEYFMTIARSFTYFLVPSVLWVVTSFGMNDRSFV